MNSNSGARYRSRHATDIDARIGSLIRQYRCACGMTQGDLADKVGVTFQQLHKWEAGRNRVAAGWLHKLATVLDVDPSVLLPPPDTDAVKMPARQVQAKQRIIQIARGAALLDDRLQFAVLKLITALTTKEIPNGTERSNDHAA